MTFSSRFNRRPLDQSTVEQQVISGSIIEEILFQNIKVIKNATEKKFDHFPYYTELFNVSRSCILFSTELLPIGSMGVDYLNTETNYSMYAIITYHNS